MSKFFLTKPINVPLSADEKVVRHKLSKLLSLKESQILSLTLHKRSIDARDKRDVRFVCSYVVESNCTSLRNATPYAAPHDLLTEEQLPNNGKSCIVVGGGPSGLFLARYLALRGVKVTVIERGSDVDRRKKCVQTFFDGGVFDENCNVQFGLGGAGTFSDGKLTTGIASPLLSTVFNEFVRCGAPHDILTNAMPHIGTDNLVNVVANMRNAIVNSGGEFLFDTFVSEIIIDKGRAVGVVVQKNGQTGQIFADAVALCCGHSAREMFHTLVKQGVNLDFKPFAVGLRVEHPREFINRVQYGPLFATHKDLGSATYKLVNNMRQRSCYSFCMCPGGVVVCANSQKETVVVNGMSNFGRDQKNSNSALVVTVTKKDMEDFGFGSDALCGVRFQESLEQAAYNLGGGNYIAPCQNVVDFLANRVSDNLEYASYPRGVVSANLRSLLPRQIGDAIADSLVVFNTKMKGFATCGVLTGVETRTSSPVKILRDESYQTNVSALYPVGEGAGYSGGIVSSAVDGLKVAQAILKTLGQ